MTMYQPGPSTDLQRAVANAVHEHWLLFLIEGIVLVLLGAAAIVVPVVATLTFTLVIGWLFLISGVVGLVTTFWMRNAPGFWWSLLSAVVSIAAKTRVTRSVRLCHSRRQSSRAGRSHGAD